MFHLFVKSLLNSHGAFYTMMRVPPKCYFYCRPFYNVRQYLSFRKFSTIVFPKEEDNENFVASFPKTKLPHRRPVPFSTANYIYTQHGISDIFSVDVGMNQTETIPLRNTSYRHILRLPDFKEIHYETLVQILKDDVSSSDMVSREKVIKLENALVYKFKELTPHEMFSVARCFFLLKHRAPKYLTTLFEYIDNNFDDFVSIDGNALNQIMFYIYFHGSCPESLLQKIEHHLSEHLDKLSLNDIGLACLGYFRANRRIRSFELLDQIAEKSIEHFPNIEPNHLIHILKSFRHAGYCKISYFEKLADFLVSKKKLFDMNFNQVMHVIMTFASTKIRHPGLIHECLQRSVELVQASSSLSHVRTKELGRIVWALGTLGVDQEDLNKVKTLIDVHIQIENAANTTPDVRRDYYYPESISDTVMGSVFLGIFPHQLISFLFEEKTVNILQGLRGLEKKMQMLFIHHSVNIECPDYLGPKLKQFMLNQFELKNRKKAIQFEFDTRPGLLYIFEELKSVMGEQNVHCHMIMPHFTTADIEIQLDPENRPVSFDPKTVKTSNHDSWKIQHEVTFDLLQMLKNPSQKQPSDCSAPKVTRRIAVQITGRNQCALNQNQFLLGIHRTKLRQLSVMGYEVLPLMPSDIADLENSCKEKRKEWILQNIIEKLNINSGSQNV